MSSDGEMSSMISPPQPTSLDLERVKQKLKRKTELLEGFLLDRECCPFRLNKFLGTKFY